MDEEVQVQGPSPRALAGFAVREARALVDRAAAPTIGRWTWHAIMRAAPDVYEALDDQQRMLYEQYLEGEPDEIKRHSQAMARGWRIAYRAMVAANEPDDAYLACQDIATGAVVVIASVANSTPEVMAAIGARADARYGDGTLVLAPHEVAAMFGPEAQAVASVKREFPGAEIVPLRGRKYERG
jgi:hypothetical protein